MRRGCFRVPVIGWRDLGGVGRCLSLFRDDAEGCSYHDETTIAPDEACAGDHSLGGMCLGWDVAGWARASRGDDLRAPDDVCSDDDFRAHDHIGAEGLHADDHLFADDDQFAGHDERLEALPAHDHELAGDHQCSANHLGAANDMRAGQGASCPCVARPDERSGHDFRPADDFRAHDHIGADAEVLE